VFITSTDPQKEMVHAQTFIDRGELRRFVHLSCDRG
jgi:hypothetical protein